MLSELTNAVFRKILAESPQSALANFKNFGNFPCAGQTLQKDMTHFRLDQSGYIAYQKLGKDRFVIGDPVIAEDRFEEILKSFLSKYPHSCFVQCSKKTALILKSLGCYLTPIGIETFLKLPYRLEGAGRCDIRHLANCSERAGLKVRELEISQLRGDFLPATFAGLTNGAIRFPGELKFLAVSSFTEKVVGTRIFAGFDNDGLVGTSLFFPMYENGKVFGYSEVVPKRNPAAPKGTRVGILLGAIRQFESEGIKVVSLGLSPFYKVKELYDSCSLSNCRESAKLFEMIYKYADFSFNYQGLSFHKSRFRGIEKAVYFASKKKLPVTELLKIYRLTTGRWLPPFFKRKVREVAIS
ncbi:MAG: DUF2156 domain-containing protein [candidate division Zixibacteria bacterium]|nr:DUF2156 domain-containing protein [candidate division Zixibacteria bacterium]